MHYAKIEFLIVIFSIITLRFVAAKRCGLLQRNVAVCCDETLRFVANAFLIANILETTPARKPKFFAKVI